MLIAIWHRYVTGSRWWLVVLCAVLAADLFIATWITSLWIPMLRDAW